MVEMDSPGGYQLMGRTLPGLLYRFRSLIRQDGGGEKLFERRYGRSVGEALTVNHRAEAGDDFVAESCRLILERQIWDHG